MTMRNRLFLYEEEIANKNIEADFLSSPFVDMKLRTLEKGRITSVLQYRPDLISLKYYGNFHMGWLIARHNLFLDPVREFTEGRLIDIPDLDNYFRYFKTNSRSE